MASFRSILARFTGLFRRRAMDERIAAERDFHVEMAAERLVRAGHPPAEARRRALLEFGARERFADEARDETRSRLVAEMLQDARYAFRSLRHSPAFTTTAVLTLVLCIGATTAMFSVVDAVLLRDLPYPEPDRIAVLCELNLGDAAGQPCNSLNPGNVMYWRRTSTTFAAIGAMRDVRVALAPPTGDAVSGMVRVANADVFRILGAHAVAGRLFGTAEDSPDAPNVTVLSQAFWQSRFGGDAGIVGQTVRINQQAFTVIGVASANAAIFDPVDAWVAIGFRPSQLTAPGRSLRGIGRLRDGVSLARADAEMRAMAATRAHDLPGVDANWTAYAMPLRERLVGGSRRALWVLFGAVGFLLLIACANVANLQLVRAAARQREFALRISLGASRARVVRQLLTENVVLAGVSAMMGFALAVRGTAALVALVPAGMAPAGLGGVTADWPVFGFAAAVALGTGVLFGVAPAWHATRTDVQSALKDGGRGASGASQRAGRLRSALVVAEMSLALVLLVAAGLMVRSFAALGRVPLGFDPSHVLTAGVTVSRSAYRTDTLVVNFFRNAESRIAALPGVEAVGSISYLPLSGSRSASGFNIEGRPAAPPGAEPTGDMRAVTPGYFRAMGIAIVSGRGFTGQDDFGSAKVAIIGEQLARTMFPGEDPIGHFLVYEWFTTERVEIVGVAADVRHEGVDKAPYMEIYRPLAQFPYTSMTMVVRGAGDPATLAGPMRAAIRELDPNVPLAQVRPMELLVAESLGRSRLSTSLFALFAGLGLLLAAVGIYGVMAYTVQQRRHEMGLRIALGASAAGVRVLVVRHGARLAALGIVIGAAGAFAVTRLMTTLLYGVSPIDAATFAATAALLGGIALVASYLPARSATAASPLELLREE